MVFCFLFIKTSIRPTKAEYADKLTPPQHTHTHTLPSSLQEQRLNLKIHYIIAFDTGIMFGRKSRVEKRGKEEKKSKKSKHRKARERVRRPCDLTNTMHAIKRRSVLERGSGVERMCGYDRRVDLQTLLTSRLLIRR